MISQDTLLDLCRSALGEDLRVVESYPRDRGLPMLRVRCSAGDVVLKVHRSAVRYAQEIHAYQNWLPKLVGECGALIATAMAGESRILILAHVPGRTLATAELGHASERTIYTQAGAILRRLHGIERLPSAVPFTEWLALRGEAWLAAVAQYVPLPRRRVVEMHLAGLAATPDRDLVPCHLDFTPGNLLVTPAGDVRLIDFELSRHDLAVRDLVKLVTRIWPDRPDLRAAFLDSYGELTTADEELIEHCIQIDYLTGLARLYRVPAPEQVPYPRLRS